MSKATIINYIEALIAMVENISESGTLIDNNQSTENDDFPCFHKNERDLIKDIRKAYQGNINVS